MANTSTNETYPYSMLQSFANTGAPKSHQHTKERRRVELGMSNELGIKIVVMQLQVDLKQGQYYPEHNDCEHIHTRGWCLDVVVAIPLAAVGAVYFPSVVVMLRRARRTNQMPWTQVSIINKHREDETYDKGANEPEDGRQEAEGNSSLPPLTSALLRDIAPSKDASTVERADEGDKQAEGDDPQHKQHEVGHVMDEAAGERNEPDESAEHGDASNDLGVDEALLRPRVGSVVRMEVATDQASYSL
ncbi:MAG: hypothetical protein M1830_007983 [Pleopsidium flavum]|nr:MAG: hypothetical protein M1830_007983 [Pleopsidium flavum]